MGRLAKLSFCAPFLQLTGQRARLEPTVAAIGIDVADS
jgi:hypothetical protein